MFGGVTSEIQTRTLPAGIKGHQLSFHYICGKCLYQKRFTDYHYFWLFSGGDDASACELNVFSEERGPLSYKKELIWSLDEGNKAIGAAALMSTTWNHVTIDLPPSDVETKVWKGMIFQFLKFMLFQISIEARHNYNKNGGVGLDNIVFSTTEKCNPQ